MSPIPITIQTDTPTDSRAQTIVIHTGVCCSDESGQFAERPYCEVVMRGTKSLGKLNEFGQPAYQDSGYIASIKLDVESLGALMPLWEQLMAATYALAAEHIAGANWVKVGTPPAAPPVQPQEPI